MDTIRKILVVEDSPDTRDAIRAILVNEGYFVQYTDNPTEALSIAEVFQPHIYILDTILPQMNGLDLLAALNISNRNTEAIIISAQENIHDTYRAVNLGAKGFLNKPIRYTELVSQVKITIERIMLREEKEIYQKSLEDLVDARTKEISSALELAEYQSRQIDLLLNSMSEPLVAVDMDCTIMLLNKAAEQTLGLNPCDCLGSPFKKYFHSPQLNQLLHSTIENFKNREIENALNPIHVKIQNKYFQVSINIVKNTIDIPSGYVLIFTDQTEIIRASQLRSGFLSLVAHEFRTPLAALLNSVSIIQEPDMEKEVMVDAIDIVLESLKRLSRLVDNLITFSNVQRSDVKAEYVQIDINNLFEAILMKNSESSTKRHIRILIDIGNIQDLIITDPVLLGDAIECILDNAIKFSQPDSDVEITAEILEMVTSETRLSISILDRGPGIPAEKQQHMFEWFWQGEDSLTRCSSGMGIGLPLALRAIEILSGSLNYAQYPLGGSIFTITIPLRTSLP